MLRGDGAGLFCIDDHDGDGAGGGGARVFGGLWSDKTPAAKVMIAGSTGSVPATRRLMRIVLGLPEGEVILPGLDIAMEADCWAGIGPTHPQYGMKLLLDALDVPLNEAAIPLAGFTVPGQPAGDSIFYRAETGAAAYVLDGKVLLLANKVVGCGFARIICKAAFFRDYRIGTRRQNYVSFQSLLFEDLVRLIGNNVGTLDVNAKGEIPHSVVDMPGFIGRHKYARCNDHAVDPTVRKYCLFEHSCDRLAVRNIAAQPDRDPAI